MREDLEHIILLAYGWMAGDIASCFVIYASGPVSERARGWPVVDCGCQHDAGHGTRSEGSMHQCLLHIRA